MNYYVWFIFICLYTNCLTAMTDMHHFEKTSVAIKINLVVQNIQNIQKQVALACNTKNALLLKQQLCALPSINMFKALYLYSNGMQKNPHEFIAHMSACLEFIQKDIRSCIQFIETNDARIAYFSNTISLMCYDILIEVDKHKAREQKGFTQKLTKQTLIDMLEDEIMHQKVQTFMRAKRHQHQKLKKYTKHSYTIRSSFTDLPNPFTDIKDQPLVELEEDQVTE